MPAFLWTKLHRRRIQRLPSERTAACNLDVDAGVVLRKVRHLEPAIDRCREVVDPVGQVALDALAEREPVVVASRKGYFRVNLAKKFAISSLASISVVYAPNGQNAVPGQQ